MLREPLTEVPGIHLIWCRFDEAEHVLRRDREVLVGDRVDQVVVQPEAFVG